jgi:hypothetical protein
MRQTRRPRYGMTPLAGIAGPLFPHPRTPPALSDEPVAGYYTAFGLH